MKIRNGNSTIKYYFFLKLIVFRRDLVEKNTVYIDTNVTTVIK